MPSLMIYRKKSPRNGVKRHWWRSRNHRRRQQRSHCRQRWKRRRRRMWDTFWILPSPSRRLGVTAACWTICAALSIRTTTIWIRWSRWMRTRWPACVWPVPHRHRDCQSPAGTGKRSLWPRATRGPGGRRCCRWKSGSSGGEPPMPVRGSGWMGWTMRLSGCESMCPIWGMTGSCPSLKPSRWPRPTSMPSGTSSTSAGSLPPIQTPKVLRSSSKANRSPLQLPPFRYPPNNSIVPFCLHKCWWWRWWWWRRRWWWWW